ncbi:MAG: DUF3750 domain-containing protein [Methylococcales bacterium]|nr:DUF3750 domain-containing protein [Methylococcales bacterium]
MPLTVQLRAAKIPGIIGHIAVHYWFVIQQDSGTDRWEIWQHPTKSEHSWGHLHKNLMAINTGVGHGDSWVEAVWQDQRAQTLAAIIERAPANYSNQNCYRYWPGPNSNTYAQWVLNQAHSSVRLSPQGIGKDYHGLLYFRHTGPLTYLSSPLFGFKLIWAQSFELHLLTCSCIIEFKPLKVYLPLTPTDKKRLIDP